VGPSNFANTKNGFGSTVIIISEGQRIIRIASGQNSAFTSRQTLARKPEFSAQVHGSLKRAYATDY
jgi:hypothetical protein